MAGVGNVAWPAWGKYMSGMGNHMTVVDNHMTVVEQGRSASLDGPDGGLLCYTSVFSYLIIPLNPPHSPVYRTGFVV